MKNYRITAAVCALLLGYSCLAYAAAVDNRQQPQNNTEATDSADQVDAQMMGGQMVPISQGKIGACVWLIVNGAARCLLQSGISPDDIAGVGAGG